MKFAASIIVVFILVFWGACRQAARIPEGPGSLGSFPVASTQASGQSSELLPFAWLHLTKAITIREYFEYLDTVVSAYDSLVPYPLNEHLIVRSNPWLIDRLMATDYYLLMEQGQFIYDPQSIEVLHPGDSLLIPGAEQVEKLLDQMARTFIDVNIPEFKLRIKEGDSTLFTMPVRVGRNETKYLAMAGRKVDLRTQPGVGEVVRVNKDPIYINPSDNHRYTVTRRDDQKVTKLPRIPWIEVELNGRRYGQLIHPTTNPATLGKAYSNGCIGTRESDAWRIYYYAPVGARVVIRYDLTTVNEQGDSILLKDIYPHRYTRASFWGEPIAAEGSAYCGCLALTQPIK